jgi:Flp pilus assembly protein TadD
MSNQEQIVAKARQEAEKGALAEAARILGGLLGEHPTHEGARVALAQITGSNGRADLEVNILVEVLQENAGCVEAAEALVQALVRDGRLDDAREFAQGFSEANPDDNRAAQLLGMVKG